MLCETGGNASSTSIDSGQPAQSGQADLGRQFLLLVHLPHAEGPYYLINGSVLIFSGFLWIHNLEPTCFTFAQTSPGFSVSAVQVL